MNNKRRLWIIIGTGVIITLVVGLLALRLTLNCCTRVSPFLLTGTTGPQVNEAVKVFLDQTGTAAYFVGLALTQTFQEKSTATYTPLPYNGDMSPTAIPRFDTITPTPTLCPPSDVICPGGNETLSPAQKVFVLMASAEGTEFRQLALTATTLATSPTPTLHSSPSTTPTATSSAQDSNCAFSWAYQDLPDAARALQTAFDDAGVTSIRAIRAEAYGENCIKADGQVSYFGAMTSDFYLAATVKNLDDADEVGQLITTAYNTITSLKIKLPAGPGYLDIIFSAGGQSKRFRTMFYQLKPLIDAGQGGAELVAVGDFS